MQPGIAATRSGRFATPAAAPGPWWTRSPNRPTKNRPTKTMQTKTMVPHICLLLADVRRTDTSSPLRRMTDEERLVADFSGTGLTVGRHPMAFHRAELERRGIVAAAALARLPHGRPARIAGCVIARQRPGTAKGFVFLSLEDETGIANAILTPAVYEQLQADGGLRKISSDRRRVAKAGERNLGEGARHPPARNQPGRSALARFSLSGAQAMGYARSDYAQGV